MTEPISVSRLAALDDVPAAEWNALAATSAVSSVFQTHEWHSAWWSVYGPGEELLLLAAHRCGELVGLLPLWIDATRTARFVGHGKSDFVDAIVAVEYDDVRTSLLREANSLARWRRLELRNLPAASPTVGVLTRLGWRALEIDATPCPTLRIAGAPEHFAEVRRKKSLRRHLNHFRKQDGYRVEHLTRAAEVHPHLAAFFEQHVGRWQGTDSPSLFLRDRDRAFYARLTDVLDATGWLRFTRLSVEDQAIAFHYGFVHSGVFVWYKPSFDIALAKKSPGEALLAELFERTAEEECDEFDFTVGDEAFKSRFANHVRSNLTLVVFANPVEFFVHRTLQHTKQRLKASRNGQRVVELVKSLRDRGSRRR
ncbi:MAG: GNAT family N-acetyltransferase [Planctomycetes bacterium]|nr:GNAT family N-acetyltransferase [Planctomycetota bacterium]MCB9888469.1 GNAT family N-acetyltransferase [Planctomycetota bacterium]